MSDSIHLQCRLHAEKDAEAVAYFQSQLDKGYSPRQIINDALIKASEKPLGETKITKDFLRKALKDIEEYLVPEILALIENESQKNLDNS